MKKIWNRYWKPSSIKWRKVGDALLIVSTSITTYGIIGKWATYIPVISLITGILGKIITNFTKEPAQPTDQAEQNQ
jgi:hypothetical protein